MGYMTTLIASLAMASLLIAPYFALRIRLKGETFPTALMNAYLPWFALAFGTFAIFPTGSGSAPLDCAATMLMAAATLQP